MDQAVRQVPADAVAAASPRTVPGEKQAMSEPRQ
jgi:hypothetical protein